jgi:hypothetical protein
MIFKKKAMRERERERERERDWKIIHTTMKTKIKSQVLLFCGKGKMWYNLIIIYIYIRPKLKYCFFPLSDSALWPMGR